MSDILEAIERVKSHEAGGARLIEDARQQAASLLAAAEEEGRRQYEILIKEARARAAAEVEAGKAEAEMIRRQTEESAAEALRQLDRAAEGRTGKAVDHLVSLFARHYGPPGGKG